jgi:dihydroorotate dehydrogenase
MGSLWEKFVRPLMFALDAERAHDIGMLALSNSLTSKVFGRVADELPTGLSVRRFGLDFANPLGLAAGFDKNALAVEALSRLGFGSIEIGTVTYEPQPGNERPRLFRLPADGALINRMGFNNEGVKAVVRRLENIERSCVIGINIGKNKTVSKEDAVSNYLKCFEVAYPAADYITINVSSPNTSGLRDLQQTDTLGELLKSIITRADELAWAGKGEGARGTRRKSILVKIAPDLSDDEVMAIADLCLEKGVDGVIATNTTLSREALRNKKLAGIGQGGLSGRPLARRSNEVISLIFRHTRGRLPIVGVGGVFSAEDAFDKIAAGACLVQAYTGFIYGGPRFAVDVLTGLARILEERGFSSVDDAVGNTAEI